MIYDWACHCSCDAEERLSGVSGCATAGYGCDAEGRRVYENGNGVVRENQYYAGGGRRVVWDRALTSQFGEADCRALQIPFEHL